jgi:hypothetical protein
MAGLDPSPPDRPKAKYDGTAPASEDRPRRRAGALRSSTESGRLPYWPRGPPACSIDLGFLGPLRFWPGRPENEAWISLDFLGFSRQNRDFSMGYAGFSAKKISRALLPLGRQRRDRSRYSYDAEMQYGSPSKPNSFSAFLQSIAGSYSDSC